MAVWVADVSKWEGSNLSIAKLKQAGIGAVIVKCGGGDVGIYTDSQWENNYAKCKAASMPTGAYWYLGATTVARAKEEAAYCLKLLKGKQFEYPVYVDVEEREHQLMSVNEPGTLAKVICAFTDALEAAGYYVGVYSWKWLLEPCGAKVAALDWWVCAWTKTKPCDCGMWQFGGETNLLRPTTVAGYKDMDQSYAYRDYPSIIKAAGLNGYEKKEVPTVATKVSNCSGTEYGGAYGGAAGDQTGREVAVISWYDFDQIAVYRHPNIKVRAELARLARETAENQHVGYDQSSRLTFRNELRKVNYAPTKITVDCETDCSACTGAIIEAVGSLLGDKKLYDFDTTLSTHYMDGPLVAAGFKKLTASKYLRSGDYLLAGDISLAPGHHVNIAVTNGSKSGESTPTGPEVYHVSQTIKFKSKSRVHTQPKVKSDYTYTYQPGETVIIDGLLIAEGYVWGTYIGATTGARRYVILGTAERVQK